MRLLRLVSDINSNEWNTQFNEPIMIEPNSKLAVNNLTAKLVPFNEAIINNQTLTIQWNGLYFNVAILDDTYNASNVNSLLQQITDDMNTEFQYDAFSQYQNATSIISSEFLISIKYGKVIAELKRCPRIEMSGVAYNGYINTIEYGVVNDPTPTTTIYWDDNTVGGNPTGGFNNRLLCDAPFIRGNGFFRAQIETLVDAGVPIDQQGFEIILSKSNRATLVAGMTNTEANYGIGISYNGGVPRVYHRVGPAITVVNTYAVEINAPPYDNTNTVVELFRNGDEIEFAYYASDGTRYIIHNEPIQGYDELEAVLVFHTNVLNCIAKRVCVNLSPFELEEIYNYATVDYWNVIDDNTQLDVTNSLTMTRTLAHFFGFNSLNITRYGNEMLIYADELIETITQLRNFILDLQNLNINSYDSQAKQRKNIIAGILSETNESLVVSKENLIFIDLLNKDPIDIRNLKIRLLNDNFQNVEIIGKAILTLLIKGPNE